MKDSKYYTCKYCFNDFEPKRRRVQKYCSNTCRSKAHHAKKSTKVTDTNKVASIKNSPTLHKEKMSIAGVGNATAGALVADGIKAIFTSEDNKNVTKGDFDMLIEKLNIRYHQIKNMKPNHLGQLPHFDFVDGVLVYF